MTCAELVELVTAFLEGALDSETERQFVEHLAICDGCEIYLEQMRRTIDEVGQLPPESLSDETRDRLLDAFRNFPRDQG
jgi:anti-sigma factor RsiW